MRRAVVILILLGAAAILAMPVAGLPWLKTVAMARTHRLDIDFPHARHADVQCLTCHHNYADHTGMTTCVDCHRDASRTDLKVSVQPRFHALCRGCHLERALEGKKHGPVRSCAACHVPLGTGGDRSALPEGGWPDTTLRQ